MATAVLGVPWHDGEKKIQDLLRVPDLDNPTVPGLNRFASLLPQVPLIAVGTLDSKQRPWTTVWGGSSGLSQPLSQSIIGIKTPVESVHDPVVQALFEKSSDGKTDGKIVSALAIDLAKRKRLKLYGRLMAGGITPVPREGEDDDDGDDGSDSQRLIQLVVRIDHSLGNCPKYMNSKLVRPVVPAPSLLSNSESLSEEAVALIRKADLFFISSTNAGVDMDTNHRGGPPGFTRVKQRDDGNFEITWPEYSGNRFYSTLGNLNNTPLAGLVFPDFDTGDVLYLTGSTEILIGPNAAKVIPRSDLAVRMIVQAARFVKLGLTFVADAGEPSPYNPRVRPLASEVPTKLDQGKGQSNTVTLMERVTITPTVSRFRFSLDQPASWAAGQWVALDFHDELDEGYSHMRDDDPLSLNDDFVRTFTISSPPATSSVKQAIEITIRRIGVVTSHLFKQNPHARLEIPVRGIGGDFRIEQPNDGVITTYIAAGVGITPLLAHLSQLDCSRLKCFWSVRDEDLNLVLDSIDRHPVLVKALHVFVTGQASTDSLKDMLHKIEHVGVRCEMRRFQKTDFEGSGFSDRWHICTSKRLYATLQEWLPGREFVYDDFEY